MNYLTELSPDITANVCPYMTIDQLKKYMNLSPQITNICGPILQSKEQEKAFLELNAQRLLEKEKFLEKINFLMTMLAPGLVLYISDIGTYPEGISYSINPIPIRDIGTDKVQIEGYPVFISPRDGQLLANILYAQPMLPSQPL